MIIRLTCGLALAMSLVIAGCGGKGEQKAAVDSGPPAVERSGTATDSPIAETPPLVEQGAEETDGSLPRKSEPDNPSATYGVADIPEEGGYIKLDLVNLSPAVLNRVLHRFRTEPATCDGCDGYTLHDILSNSPDCMPCLIRSREIIAEETARR
jgi:hypothetical protein